MEIRYMRPDDDPLEISRIYEKSWKFAYKGIVPQDHLNNIPAGRWVNSLNTNRTNNLLLIENGQIIGTACICRSRWEKYSSHGEIVSIYFLPEYIGMGYGRALLNRCVDELHERGFRKILLWVLEDNRRARKFYEKNGFICVEEYLNTIIGGKELREVMYLI